MGLKPAGPETGEKIKGCRGGVGARCRRLGPAAPSGMQEPAPSTARSCRAPNLPVRHCHALLPTGGLWHEVGSPGSASPGASRGSSVAASHVHVRRRGLGAGRGRAATEQLRAPPTPTLRKWLRFSERKREVGLPRRGSQQLPLARSLAPCLLPGSCRLPRVHELRGKERGGCRESRVRAAAPGGTSRPGC